MNKFWQRKLGFTESQISERSPKRRGHITKGKFLECGLDLESKGEVKAGRKSLFEAIRSEKVENATGRESGADNVSVFLIYVSCHALPWCARPTTADSRVLWCQLSQIIGVNPCLTCLVAYCDGMTKLSEHPNTFSPTWSTSTCWKSNVIMQNLVFPVTPKYKNYLVLLPETLLQSVAQPKIAEFNGFCIKRHKVTYLSCGYSHNNMLCRHMNPSQLNYCGPTSPQLRDNAKNLRIRTTYTYNFYKKFTTSENSHTGIFLEGSKK